MKYLRIKSNLGIVLLIVSFLFFVKPVLSQNTDKQPKRLGVEASIETVLPIDKNCLMVIGGFYSFGDNFALKDCGQTFKIQNLGSFGNFFNAQSRGENHWAIVSGSLVKLDLNNKTLKLEIIKQKTNDLFLTDVYFIDGKRGWICGDDGLILFTDDGGKSWNEQNSKTDIDLRQIRFADNDFGWSFGRENKDGKFLDIFLTTKDGGKRWEKVEIPSRKSFISANFKGREICGLTDFTSATCYNAETEKWQSFTFENNNTADIYFINEKIGFIIGDKILKTNDGGKNWVNKLEENNLDDISFLNERIGFAWGLNAVYKTTDGGEIWQKISEKWFQ